MADQWFYAQNGQQNGPVSYEQLAQLARTGGLTAGDLVWQEGTPDWQPAGQVAGLFAAATGGYAPPPAPYGAPQPQHQVPQYGVAGQAHVPQYAQPYGQPTYGMAQSYANDARTAMILAIVGIFCFGIILEPIALVLGYKAKKNMRASGNMEGEGMATAAIVIGWIMVGLVVLWILLMVVMGIANA